MDTTVCANCQMNFAFKKWDEGGEYCLHASSAPAYPDLAEQTLIL